MNLELLSGIPAICLENVFFWLHAQKWFEALHDMDSMWLTYECFWKGANLNFSNLSIASTTQILSLEYFPCSNRFRHLIKRYKTFKNVSKSNGNPIFQTDFWRLKSVLQYHFMR